MSGGLIIKTDVEWLDVRIVVPSERLTKNIAALINRKTLNGD